MWLAYAATYLHNIHMDKHSLAVALSIAGSDSCGGAGIQADLKTFTVLGVYGMTVLTAITAQNTLGVQAVVELSPEIIREQFRSVTSDIVPSAVKTGMLASAAIINLVADELTTLGCPYVCDPVMVAKSGDQLLTPGAASAIRERLLPIAWVLTPNRFEAQQLLGTEVRTLEQARGAARALAMLGPRSVIIKGIEHGTGICDVLYDGGEYVILEGQKQPLGKSHGSGCTFSAAITAELAKGSSLVQAARTARILIDDAIRESFSACKGANPVNVLAYRR